MSPLLIFLASLAVCFIVGMTVIMAWFWVSDWRQDRLDRASLGRARSTGPRRQ